MSDIISLISYQKIKLITIKMEARYLLRKFNLITKEENYRRYLDDGYRLRPLVAKLNYWEYEKLMKYRLHHPVLWV